jgi:hypothetical protein
MPYNLPRFEETFIAKESGWTFLMWRRGFNGEDGWVSRFPYEIDHRSAWKRHDAGTRRFRTAQRLYWWGGRYFEFTRRIVNHMLYT